MEHSHTQGSVRPPSAKLSPLKQHPVTRVLPSFPQDATQTIFLNHPSARISSSPASSPRIIEPDVSRRESVHPKMSDTMEKGLQPGADFFDDSSESEWEDSEGDMTQTFSMDGQSNGMRSMVHGLTCDVRDSTRGRGRERTNLAALPLFDQFTKRNSNTDIGPEAKAVPSQLKGDGTKMAREMSLKRLGKENVRVVHNHSTSGTPRDSLKSNPSGDEFPDFFQPPHGMRSLSADPQDSKSQSRHRRNTSGSVIAGSIINAHIMTMRALESLNQSPSDNLDTSNNHALPFNKLASFSSSRRITLPPLRTASADRDHFRPPHLPDHFIKTPYPFTAKKDFPKPRSRPRQHIVSSARHSAGMDRMARLDSGYNSEKTRREHDDRKGKHVLGLEASGGVYDLRSGLQRNEDAQGVIRSRSEPDKENSQSEVWLSLERGTFRSTDSNHTMRKLEKIIVPSSLTASSPACAGGRGVTVDFDDYYFAERLHEGHNRLAGSWIRRTFRAKQLHAIRLAQLHTWSGVTSPVAPSGLLAAGAGFDLDADTRSPFTEEGLMSLYRRPSNGKARYTWVHWAHRVAASNSPCQSIQEPRNELQRRRTTSLSHSPEKESPLVVETEVASISTKLPESITTVQFVYILSTTRIVVVLAFMLVLSMIAAVLWVLLGTSRTGVRVGTSRERSERVGSGMAVGILVLLVECVGFGGWVALS